MKPIDFDGSVSSFDDWHEMMKEKLTTATKFEIHCWKEEEEWLSLIKKYGKEKFSTWERGKVIEGDVTPEFCDMLLSIGEIEEKEGANKMTPFFTIFLDNGFSSEHYGSEVYQV